MNGRTARLLSRYATQTGKSLKAVKREWHSTKTKQRGEVRRLMISGMWSATLRAWQKRMGWIQKEAADKLGVAFETYRNWVDADAIPRREAQLEIERRMRQLEVATS